MVLIGQQHGNLDLPVSGARRRLRSQLMRDDTSQAGLQFGLHLQQRFDIRGREMQRRKLRQRAIDPRQGAKQPGFEIRRRARRAPGALRGKTRLQVNARALHRRGQALGGAHPFRPRQLTAQLVDRLAQACRRRVAQGQGLQRLQHRGQRRAGQSASRGEQRPRALGIRGVREGIENAQRGNRPQRFHFQH